MENLKAIFKEELEDILIKYVWKINSEDTRKKMINEIQETLFNQPITKKAKVIDKTSLEEENQGKYCFKVRESRKEYSFSAYIEKLYDALKLDEENGVGDE